MAQAIDTHENCVEDIDEYWTMVEQQQQIHSLIRYLVIGIVSVVMSLTMLALWRHWRCIRRMLHRMDADRRVRREVSSRVGKGRRGLSRNEIEAAVPEMTGSGQSYLCCMSHAG